MEPIRVASSQPRITVSSHNDARAGSDARTDAFSCMFRRHFDAVAGYAIRRSSATDAADVIAETFLVAWRRFDDVPGESETLAWLLGVARKALANLRRGRARRSRLGHRLAGEIEAMRGTERPDFADASADRLVVRAALDRLAPDDRELLLMSVWEGLTSAEIGVVLDLPPPTVRTRLHRARAQMRSDIGQDPEEDA